ncbi:N-acetyltransferase [Cryobacterium sp. TMT1-21]|uniref:N-acetyltransferase n=1 Tax=Cryobacterium shii TaxID=1259235 RepID=A0AAQ2HFI7_9MICO|nr:MULTISPECIES: GNAT family protein [Cryobacterium]TFC46565.1 N-acetyltransferase [Cryobacterium shii]TFC82676.1 N-acetyltransferase [Cryobacterium sp. TmT2-59]TFD12108.1 N-acetyltransferase [Cryobacterium sp. TMT1-21]TFD12284.1 N-acetyltransferase [Cryobacterium sp. TMT4-10]TFD19331.1 N-acetyltransferase [Cryobacterium sp. TMT2-23]
MTAERPQSIAIVGHFVRLEPLTRALLPELRDAIAHPLVFEGGFGGGPGGLRAGLGEFAGWADAYVQWAGLPYAVRLLGGAHDGDLVGMSTLGDLHLANESAHLGWTAYNPRVWGTAVNAETKLLLLGLAFDHGFGRVKIQADVMNVRSCAAVAGVGATYEGIVRRERRRADGSWRDTVVFSILDSEWPRVRAGLRARLDGYGAQPVEYRQRPFETSDAA